MAKFGKAHYLILTESFGESLADAQPSGALAESTVLNTARKLAKHLEHDNSGFNAKQFIEGIQATAELSTLAKKGIH
jgi:hypothetical protein